MNLAAILLSFFYYFYFSMIGIYIIFLPKVLAGLGYSAWEIGVVFGASPLVRFLLPFVFLSRLQLSHQIFNGALVLLLLGSVSFYLSLEHFGALLVSNVVLGLGMSLSLPYIETIALEIIGRHRYGKVRLFGSLGFILVALVLVHYIANPYNALNFLVVLALLTIIFAFFIVKKFHKEAQKPQNTQSKIKIDFLADYKLWIGLTLMQVSFGAFYNFFTIYETNYGISMDITIYLWSFGVVSEIVMLFFQGRVLHYNLLALLQITTFVTVLRWLLVFAFAQNLWILFLSQSLHALSFALFHSAAISYLHQIYKEKTLAQQFFSGITYGFGGLSGALLAGFIYEYFPRYLFLSAACFALLSFVFLRLYAKEQKTTPQKGIEA